MLQELCLSYRGQMQVYVKSDVSEKAQKILRFSKHPLNQNSDGWMGSKQLKSLSVYQTRASL